MQELEHVTQAIEETDAYCQALDRVDPTLLQAPAAPGKWTGVQILAHVAESDMIVYTRIHQALWETSDTLFAVPDPMGDWMDVIRGDARPAAVSIATIHGARTGILWTLRNVPPERLSRQLNHAELGQVSALWYASVMASHGAHHIEQIRCLPGVADAAGAHE